MKKTLFLLLFAGALSMMAWQVDSSYRIVLPETPRDKSIGRALAEGAAGLQYALEQSGIKIPVVTEKEPVPGKKSIFIGFPDGRQYNYFDGSIRIAGQDVYLTGNDRHGFGKEGPNNSPRGYYLGSISALVKFMEAYLDVRFVLPDRSGIVPGKARDLPETLDEAVRPKLQFASGRDLGLLHDYANANYGRSSFYVYGGHSHNTAVPQKTYAQSNPEYFSLVKDKRTANDHYHGHCLSNPAVADLIYAEMLKQLDAGAETVELAQTDGNKPCECENCKELYGVSDPGEKLWIFHTRLAERLLKERPDKKVLIICYWPNIEPPKTFKKFPANVMIEITNYLDSDLAKWQGYEVPQGFLFYIYNWGYYQLEGFTPKNCEPQFLADQVRQFNAFGIKGLYRCGYGELFGLEGAGYYIYGQLWSRPEADPKALLKEYCERVFGDAAPEMERFYTLLYDRQKLTIYPPGTLKWTHVEHQKRAVGELEAPQRLLVLRYPEPVLAELESLLKAAEQKTQTPAAKWLAPRLTTEFAYLQYTAGIANCMDKLSKQADPESGRKMLELVVRRNTLIAELPKLSPQLFGVASKELLRNGGRMYGLLSFPYNLEAEALLKSNAIPCGRLWKMDSTPQLLCGDNSKFPTTLSAAVEGENLLVRFHLNREKSSELGEDKLGFYVEGAQGKIYKFQGWLDANKRVFASIREKSSTENNGGDEQLARVEPRGCSLTLRDEAEGAIAEFSVPFALIDGKPAPGTQRKFNASRLRYVPGNNKAQSVFLVWEYNPGKLNWRQDIDRYGIMEF